MKVVAAALVVMGCGRIHYDPLPGGDSGVDSVVDSGVDSSGSTTLTLAGGDRHSCAVLADTRVMCWGENNKGQLGDDTTMQRLSPTAVANLTGVMGLIAGGEFSCALGSDDTANCWGANGLGQLGDGTDIERPVAGPVTDLVDIADISAGTWHACSRARTGEVYCWGRNVRGTIGDGTFETRLSPIRVAGLPAIGALTAGDSHVCVASQMEGAVWCWGGNSKGQLGNGVGDSDRDGTTDTESATPVQLPGLTGVVELTAGDSSTCARTTSGAVLCWGWNGSGQLGDDTLTDRSTPAPVLGLTDAIQIDGGETHTCALRSTGVVVCWGANGEGQLGDGTTTRRDVPTPIVDLPVALDEVSAGDDHTCARDINGAVYCWGSNSDGQLGDGTTDSSTLPVQVLDL